MRKLTGSRWTAVLAAAVVVVAALGAPAASWAQDLPDYLYDRGRGVPGSLFGTYIEKGDRLFYLYYEFYYDKTDEYSPVEFGFFDPADYYGKSIENEFLVFLGYGLTEDIAVELEAAYYTHKTLQKDPDDLSGMPNSVTESGLGDVESQVRWRWKEETGSSPELFSFFEVVFPFQENKKIIGTQDWEFSLGFGAVKGLSWGTLTGRVSAVYTTESDEFESGEYGVEYLKRISDTWRVVAAVEGTEDEVELIGESQHALTESATLKLNAAFGLTKKAGDFAPEIGVMWKF